MLSPLTFPLDRLQDAEPAQPDSLRKLAITVDMVDRAQTWRAAAGPASEVTP